MTIQGEYQAKYMVLTAWVSEKTGLSEDEVNEVVDEMYAKHFKQDLEEYCKKLYEDEDLR
jgi:phosphoserine phosphatase